MKVRVKAYAPAGASLGILPAPATISASLVLGDTGAMSLEYGTTAPQASLLDAPCELALEVSQDNGATWVEPDDARYVYLRRKGDSVKRPSHLTAEAAAYSWRLTTAKVLPSGLLNADGKRGFTTATPGTILATLIQEAQTRGALTGMAKDFTTALDSNGVAWASTLTIAYAPGMDYLAIVRNLFDQGLIDFRFRGRTLQVFNADTAMARRLDAANPVVDLRYGRDLTEAPYQGTWEALANFAYVQGDLGTSLERTNGSAYAPWGRQETFIAQGGITDPGTMTTLADASLSDTAAERMERTYGLSLSAARWHPLTDYALGDFVAVGDGSVPLNHLTAYRVRQVTLKVDAKGLLDGNVVLNDRFIEQEIRTSRRVTGILGGSTISGGSGASPVPPAAPPVLDTLAPGATSGLAASSAAYLDTVGAPHAQVTLSWSKVVVNSNGTACDDLDHYDVFRRTNTGGTIWTPSPADITDVAGTVSWSHSPYDTGTGWVFKVRAVDKSGNVGAFSADLVVTMATDATPPPVPSTPTVFVRLGVVSVSWDGLDNLGNAMPLDLGAVELHRSQVSGFTPDATTLAARVGSKGMVVFSGQVYGTTWYYRLKAIDTSKNASGPSIQANATTTPLVATDVVGKVLDGANVMDGTVGTATLTTAVQVWVDSKETPTAAQAKADAAQVAAQSAAAADAQTKATAAQNAAVAAAATDAQAKANAAQSAAITAAATDAQAKADAAKAAALTAAATDAQAKADAAQAAAVASAATNTDAKATATLASAATDAQTKADAAKVAAQAAAATDAQSKANAAQAAAVAAAATDAQTKADAAQAAAIAAAATTAQSKADAAQAAAIASAAATAQSKADSAQAAALAGAATDAQTKADAAQAAAVASAATNTSSTATTTLATAATDAQTKADAAKAAAQAAAATDAQSKANAAQAAATSAAATDASTKADAAQTAAVNAAATAASTAYQPTTTLVNTWKHPTDQTKIDGGNLYTGSVTAAKILADTITAAQIATNAITADELAANSVTADTIRAGAITAVALAADAIDGKTITGSTLRTAAAGARFEVDTFGARLYDAVGNLDVNLPTDPNQAAYFSGNILATGLTVQDLLSLQGVNNEFAAQSVTTLQSGVMPPTTAPAVSLGFPEVVLVGNWDESQSYVGLWVPPSGGGFSRGWQHYNPFSPTDWGLHFAIEHFDAAGNLLTTTDLTGAWGDNVIGACEDATTYTLLLKPTWMTAYDYQLSGIAKPGPSGGGSVVTVSLPSTSHKPTIFNDGSWLYLAYMTATQVIIERRDPQTFSVLGTYAGSNGGLARDLTAGMGLANFDFGSARFILTDDVVGAYGYVWTVSGSTLTRSAVDDWILPYSRVPYGFAWDGVRFFVGSNDQPDSLVEMSEINWSAVGTAYWYASFTWYHTVNGWQSKVSPLTKFSMAKRSWITLSTPPFPNITNPGVPPDSVMTYLSNSALAGPPLAQQFHPAGTPPTAAQRTYVYGASPYSFTGANPPNAGTFPTLVAGLLRSAAVRSDGTTPIWSLSGDGIISMSKNLQRGQFATVAHGATTGASAGSVVFPEGPMQVPPAVVMTAGTSRLTCSVSAITVSGFNWSINNWSPGAAGISFANWIAVAI